MMDRRMQRNEAYCTAMRHKRDDSIGGCNRHCREHDENTGCHLGTPCQPVLATVTVPATGSHLVIDGESHEVEDVRAVDEWQFGSPRRTYSMRVKPPKPTFFEEGKTYVTGWGVRFEVDRVMGGVAFGHYTHPSTDEDKWTTMTDFDAWREV